MSRSAIVILLILPAPGLAADGGWSLGAQLGTRFVPNAYPVAFPPRVDAYDFDRDGTTGDDVDGDGIPDATTLERVRGDVLLEIDATHGVPGLGRLGVAGTLDVGRRFTEAGLLFTLERTFDFQVTTLLAGGGVGFATATWRGGDEDERLHVPSYPFRAQGGVLVPVVDRFALQGRVFAQVAVPSSHTYVDLAGHEQEVSGMPLLYSTIGLQLGVSVSPSRGASADAAIDPPSEPAAPEAPAEAPPSE